MTAPIDRIWVDCACDAPQHSVRITLYRWSERRDDAELWISVPLVRHRFWRRLWYALRYVCGCQDQVYEETIVSPESAQQLQDLLRGYIDTIKLE